ncbi:hypothetical protein I317_06937 [Kwoniella heveanensis CBS 569]|nr:hypothetical protein I317_06937 [Kwoniella heveanensis CBS 569]
MAQELDQSRHQIKDLETRLQDSRDFLSYSLDGLQSNIQSGTDRLVSVAGHARFRGLKKQAAFARECTADPDLEDKVVDCYRQDSNFRSFVERTLRSMITEAYQSAVTAAPPGTEPSKLPVNPSFDVQVSSSIETGGTITLSPNTRSPFTNACTIDIPLVRTWDTALSEAYTRCGLDEQGKPGPTMLEAIESVIDYGGREAGKIKCRSMHEKAGRALDRALAASVQDAYCGDSSVRRTLRPLALNAASIMSRSIDWQSGKVHYTRNSLTESVLFEARRKSAGTSSQIDLDCLGDIMKDEPSVPAGSVIVEDISFTDPDLLTGLKSAGFDARGYLIRAEHYPSIESVLRAPSDRQSSVV